MSDTSNTPSTDIVRTVDDNAVLDAIDAIKTGNALAYSSIQGTDFDSKLRTLEAVTNSEAIKVNLGRTINLKDIVIQAIDMVDEASGEVVKQPRIIFLDTEGNAYHAISGGLLRSVNNIIGIMGEPSTWPEGGVPVTFAQGGSGTRQYFTIKFGAAAKAKKS